MDISHELMRELGQCWCPHITPTASVHIRSQQRTGKKCWTTIQGLASDLDLKKIVTALKKTLATNGAIIDDPKLGPIVQLQGDQREKTKELLLAWKICEAPDILVHGF